MLKNIKIEIILLILILPLSLIAQVKEYRIHSRGMLHETVFNTGDIGRGWMVGEAGNVTSTPLMEWPSRSKTYTDGLEYSGQHNILGGGMYMAANIKGKPGIENRIYAFCGGVGASQPEVVFGRWSFPLYMERIENYPLLADGTLNPDYNPDEAEEIIKAGWATPLGVTVHRTSRAWSYPDYDDMIIYEYELEYNGDTDGNPETIERDSVLTDFMPLFIYGFAPSMYGYQRHYQEWKYEAGIYRGDQNNFWDADYWLSFNLNLRTNGDENLPFKPEPNVDNFFKFAQTGEKGGGLTSPQAPGFSVLFYDNLHLAVVDPFDPAKNESEFVSSLRTVGGIYFELDDNGNVKQPYSNKVSTGNTRSSKMMIEAINPDKRWSGVYSKGSTTWPEVPNYDTTWWGRAAYPYRQSADAGQKHIVFGPYTLHHGDVLKFAFAEVVGYGAEPNKRLEGGQTQVQWAKTPSLDTKIVMNGQTLTEHYLTDYGYPDYVNSDVKTVTDVALKALQAYTGAEPVRDVPVWPDANPRAGSYKIPVPPPAPITTVENTVDGSIRITWNKSAEEFTHPRLTGPLTTYKIYRSVEGMGPFELLGEINKGAVNPDGIYEFVDSDPDFKIGESRFYAVTSIDPNGNESGKTNITKFSKNVGSVDKMDKVYVVPNPFVSKSGFVGGGETDNQLGFYGLPNQCTIRIFSYSGQLVETIEHDVPVYSTAWFQTTRNGQEIASGIYFYVVTTPTGEVFKGKFVVIK